jgi:integrase/recombinase XerD
MYGTGLRISEVRAFKLEDIRFHEEHAQAIVVGGGKRKRLVVLSAAAKKSLGSWLTWSREHFGIRPEDHDGYIWVTVAKKSGTRGRGTPLDRQAISQMLERYRGLAGIEQKVTPQVLRNTFAHELEMAGVEQKVIGAILGYQGVEVYSPESPSESVDGVAEKAVALLPDVWQE